jgi:negative regulator of sigma E activity
MNDAIRMQISAFVDGALPENESELLVRRLCQDAELRQQVAEYYAIGRVMRGELSVPGMAALRERIAGALDESAGQATYDALEPEKRNYLRPLSGFAIAATVAVVALLGIQQLNGVPDADRGVDAVADEAGPAAGYTVPSVYHELHREGARNINARLATLRMLEEELDELDTDAESEDAETGAAPLAPAAGTP